MDRLTPFGRYVATALLTSFALLLVVLLTPLGKLVFTPLAALVSSAVWGLLGNPADAVRFSAVPPAFTAAPVFLLGLGFVVAWPTTLGRKLVGVAILFINTTLINTMFLVWGAAQVPALNPALSGREAEAARAALATAAQAELRPAFELAYPLVMAFVLVVSFAYWMLRVARGGWRQAAPVSEESPSSE